MIRYYCDRCHKEIDGGEYANVFRMWNLTRADALGIYELASIAFDQDFLVCDECFEKLCDFMDKAVGE